MKVLSVYYTHKSGGFCKRLYRLLNALSEKGHDLTYVTLDPPPESLSKKVSIQLMPFPLKTRRGLFFWGLFTFWCPLYLALNYRNLCPDRIVVFGAYYSSMTVFLRKLCGAKTTLFLRSLVFRIDELTQKPFLIRKASAFVERVGMSSADKVIFMTAAMQTEVERFLGKKLPQVATLPNEVPTHSQEQAALPEALQELLAPYSSELVVLTSGVLDQRKNIEFLLDTFSELRDESITLLVAGDGPLLESLKSQAGDSKVLFLGWVDSLASLFPLVSLVVHPSVHEGVPNSLLEPLAADIPVLASDIPEHRELLVDQELLFSLESPLELGDRLKKLRTEGLDELRKLSSDRARKLSFDWELKACSLALS